MSQRCLPVKNIWLIRQQIKGWECGMVLSIRKALGSTPSTKKRRK
jgi:hypothetical protein